MFAVFWRKFLLMSCAGHSYREDSSLLAIWDEQAASAARKLERSENAIAGGFYTGAMFGYEDCADNLAMLLKEVLTAEIGQLIPGTNPTLRPANALVESYRGIFIE